jgi:hypothetical protein
MVGEDPAGYARELLLVRLFQRPAGDVVGVKAQLDVL